MQNYMVVWKGVPQRAGQVVGYGIVAFAGYKLNYCGDLHTDPADRKIQTYLAISTIW